MKLIVDANIILSALIKESMTRKILNSDFFEFYTCDYVVLEVLRYNSFILKKTHLTQNELQLLLTLIMENINVVDNKLIKKYMLEAKRVMRSFDIYDAPILACAFAVSNADIWSEDKHFEQQKKVRVWKTKDLISFIK